VRCAVGNRRIGGMLVQHSRYSADMAQPPIPARCALSGLALKRYRAPERTPTIEESTRRDFLKQAMKLELAAFIRATHSHNRSIADLLPPLRPATIGAQRFAVNDKTNQEVGSL
jgi:hypothetical protein